MSHHRAEIALAQLGVFVPQPDRVMVELFQCVRLGLPWHGMAVLFLQKAGDPFFVPIKHRGYPHKGHLEQHGKLHALDVVATQGKETAHVMAVQQV